MREDPYPVTLIETIADLEDLAERLKGEPRIGVDVESDSFYSYHDKVCLLQLSSSGEDIVIDPLAVKDLSPLGPMFRDPAVEKIFHACEYDILCLKRDFGFGIHNIFDTLVAARSLGSAKLGLAALIEIYFGVKLSKKLQRADWGKRPMSLEQIEYARNDTHYLLRLRDILSDELKAKGLLEDAADEFARLEKIEPVDRSFDPESFWSLRGAKDLSPQARAVLRGLYLFRERTAAGLDKTPFRVLPEDLLVRLAERLPADREAVRTVPGMTPYLFRRFGSELLAEIAQGLAAEPIDSPPERPRRHDWDGDSLRHYEALRLWRKGVAEKRGVNPVVILPTDELRRVAQAASRSEKPEDWVAPLSSYKVDLYGAEILGILRAPKPSKSKRRRRRRSAP